MKMLFGGSRVVPKNHVLDDGAYCRQLTNTIAQCVRGNTALWQISNAAYDYKTVATSYY